MAYSSIAVSASATPGPVAPGGQPAGSAQGDGAGDNGSDNRDNRDYQRRCLRPPHRTTLSVNRNGPPYCGHTRALKPPGSPQSSAQHSAMESRTSRDPLLRRSVCAAGQPACSQVRRRIRVSASDRKSPPLTGRSGTQRARRPGSRTTAGTSAPWSSSSSSELRITRVSPCVAREPKTGASLMFAGS